MSSCEHRVAPVGVEPARVGGLVDHCVSPSRSAQPAACRGGAERHDAALADVDDDDDEQVAHGTRASVRYGLIGGNAARRPHFSGPASG
jgi:hypothetical protein